MSGRLLVEARGLTKTYPARNGTPAFCAVDGIDFELERGEAFGFLGPNGAGKSSTMRMVGATSPVSAGELRVLGMDPAREGPAIRARIGVVPQDDCLDRELTVRENLFIYGRYFGLKKNVIRERLAGLLAFAQLEEKADAPGAARMLPMFLFATTFYPLSVYPGWARPVIEILPLYQSIQLVREPALGALHWNVAIAVLYLAAFGRVALAIATRRLTRQLLP